MTQRKNSPVRAVTDQDKPFLFQHEGKAYKLPPVEQALKNVPGGDFMDAMLDDDEQAQLKLAFKALKDSGVSPEAYAALRSKPIVEFSEVVGNWLNSGGASLGE